MTHRRSTPRRHIVVGLLGALLLSMAAPTARSEEASPPTRFRANQVAERALIVSIDGLRPDVLLRADAPTIRGLMAAGSFTMWAVTTPVAVTLPSHTSMLTGVPPEKHGVTWNDDRPADRRVYPKVPTLFEVARRAGRTTALAAGKSKFSALLKPGTLDLAMVPTNGEMADTAVADTVAHWIRTRRPQVIFVHLADVDLTGHEHGWGSSAQLASIAVADRCVGRLLAALEAGGLRDSTILLVTSDHGGAGTSHGRDDPRSRHIPWILAGPGIRRNLELTGTKGLTVRTEDTFATLCELLGLDTPRKGIEGRSVRAALDSTPSRR
ncbi:MAG TPA: ectonucleotide pyrophosphatase/phosphodiesterase [Candidatus Eisenbacteria bacterium]|nr:ectonucleotide pyrophosphatase/phosphodiesterase [Candidatus Eisenbacteria bacterium]